MSTSLANPSPAAPLRGLVARVWADPDGRSTVVGVGGVIAFYLLLWGLSPWLFRYTPAVRKFPDHPENRQFNIEVAPEAFAPKPVAKPPPPNKFVETNPDAPENIPDKTTNFAAQNQQVAQEKPQPKGTNDMPAMEGKKDFQSNQIVSGQLAKPLEQMEAVPPAEFTPPREQTVAAPVLEQNPLSGFEKKQGDNAESYGTNIAKLMANARAVPDKVEGVQNVPLIQGANATQPAIDPLRPRPRPSVVKTQQVRPAILAERLAGTANIGPTSVDARWSNYGAYLQKMIEAVQIQWERLLTESKIYPTSGSTVTVKFIMDSKGLIARVVNVDSTASDAASRACMSAITDRAPYGDWTEDMKAVLGEQQEMTFTFYYQ
jgi:hypothetical protein